jgi:hypothetical protein
LPPPQPTAQAAEKSNDQPPEPPPFDFNREMRATRQVVDRLLAHGYVAEAEAYMEARRQRFVAHGYPLRVLNQAYFAFHGSYATGPAATDPIGPKLRELRRLSPSLGAFLRTVEDMTSVADIDAAIERLQSEDSPRQEVNSPPDGQRGQGMLGLTVQAGCAIIATLLAQPEPPLAILTTGGDAQCT